MGSNILLRLRRFGRAMLYDVQQFLRYMAVFDGKWLLCCTLCNNG